MANGVSYDTSNMPMIVGDFRIQDFWVTVSYPDGNADAEDIVITPESGLSTSRSILRKRPMKISIKMTGERYTRSGFSEFVDTYIQDAEGLGYKKGLDFAWTVTVEGVQYSSPECYISRAYLDGSPYVREESKLEVVLTLPYYFTDKI